MATALTWHNGNTPEYACSLYMQGSRQVNRKLDNRFTAMQSGIYECIT